jgi:hypothetical protein
MAAVGRAGLLVLACALCAGCSDDPRALDFRIQFANAALAQRAARIEARILLHGCDGDEALYVSSFAPDERGALPEVLANGRYGFDARALDLGCRWYAHGCSELSLPSGGHGFAVVTLNALPSPALDCASDGCDSRACMAGTDAATSRDAGELDAASADGATARDAAGDDDDGGGDASLPVTIEIEAEDADPLRAPLMRIDDPMVSGGAYISYPWTSDQTLDQRNMLKRAMPPADDSADGLAFYAFELPAGGDFRLWGRVNPPTLEEDSFWLRIDDQPWIQWNDIAHEDPWHWDDVRPFETRNERFFITLTPGTHDMVISYRELGARLDKLLLTSDAELVPSG